VGGGNRRPGHGTGDPGKEGGSRGQTRLGGRVQGRASRGRVGRGERVGFRGAGSGVGGVLGGPGGVRRGGWGCTVGVVDRVKLSVVRGREVSFWGRLHGVKPD
jgi:hypothetical protein